MLSPAQRTAALPQPERARILEALTDEEKAALEYDWSFWARPNQLAPAGNWFIWFIRAGRGAGKTRTSAEWVLSRVEQGHKRIALIGQTKADVRDTMIEIEESSIMKIAAPWLMPKYEPSKRRLMWENGAVATTFSGDEPDQLRGPQFSTAWVDELAKFKYPRETWNNLMFGLRLTDDPKVVVSTTPRPLPLIKEILARPDCVDVVHSSFENWANLSEVYIKNLMETYQGTRLGKQEIEGQILEDNPDALWQLTQIEALRVKEAPQLRRVVVGIDPAVSTNKNSNETGIIIVGKGYDNHIYVLADRSGKYSPDKWAKEAIAAYNFYEGDKIIAEKNMGGDLVESNLRTVNTDIPIKLVSATRGKAIRAEPIAALYEQGKVHHVGTLSDLETQMTDWNPQEDKTSPDRVDALIWGCVSLTSGSMYYGNVSLEGNREFMRISPNRI